MQTTLKISSLDASRNVVSIAPVKDVRHILFGEVSGGVLNDAYDAAHMAGVGTLQQARPGCTRQFLVECITEDVLGATIPVDDYFDLCDLKQMRADFVLANIEATAEAGRREVREAFAKLAH